MINLFSKAADFYSRIPHVHQSHPARDEALKKLESVLINTKILPPEQKESLRKIIPFFSTDVLQTLSGTLIRENLRLLNRKYTNFKPQKKK